MSTMKGRGKTTASATPPAGLLLEKFLPYRLAVVADAVSRALGEVYGARFGLTIAEWRIIANLGRFGPLYAGAIAVRSSLEKPTVSRALRRLQVAKRVTRTVDPADKRNVCIELTPQGQETFAAIAALALEWEMELLAPLSGTERRQLDRTLAKLAARAATLRR